MDCDHFSCDELSSTSDEDVVSHPSAAAGGVAEDGGRDDTVPGHAGSWASAAGAAEQPPAADAAFAADDDVGDLYSDIDAGPQHLSAEAAAAADVELDDLYSNIDAGPQLPSDLTLRRVLASVTSEREALEVEVARLSGEIGAAKAQLQQSLRNACTILCTARLEIQRKRARLADARAQARRDGGRGYGSVRGAAPAAHGLAAGGHFGGAGRCGGSGPVVDGVGRRKRAAAIAEET
jgi:hypothetical protein